MRKTDVQKFVGEKAWLSEQHAKNIRKKVSHKRLPDQVRELETMEPLDECENWKASMRLLDLPDEVVEALWFEATVVPFAE